MASKVTDKKPPDSPARPRAAATPENSEAAIWGRLIDPQGDDLSEDAARSFLRMTFRATQPPPKKLIALSKIEEIGRIDE